MEKIRLKLDYMIRQACLVFGLNKNMLLRIMYILNYICLRLVKCTIEEKVLDEINRIRENDGVDNIYRHKSLDSVAKKAVLYASSVEYPTVNTEEGKRDLQNELLEAGYKYPIKVLEISMFAAMNDDENLIERLKLATNKGDAILKEYDDVGISAVKHDNKRYWDFVFASRKAISDDIKNNIEGDIIQNDENPKQIEEEN